jgi:hypothetical protein
MSTIKSGINKLFSRTARNGIYCFRPVKDPVNKVRLISVAVRRPAVFSVCRLLYRKMTVVLRN